MSDTVAPELEFHSVEKHFGATVAVAGVTISIARGEFVALVGTSGSGKSTLLKTINRLVEPSSGEILFEGENVARRPLAQLRRNIGYVFQGIGLFPHMTIGENVALGPRLAGESMGDDRIGETLELVDLPPDMRQRMPSELSGGQRQRVGVARALATQPQLLLMDEPFGALDPITRDALGERVRSLHHELGITTIMVTHDMAEALLLADRVLVMQAGRIEADCAPRELLHGEGGDFAQELVAVPRAQSERLAALKQ
ncbi:MAG: ABC transporter ATP-binding protein [Sphingomonadaceae bacterium]